MGSGELDRFMTEQHSGDGGGRFGSIDGSSTQTLMFTDEFTDEEFGDRMADSGERTIEWPYMGEVAFWSF